MFYASARDITERKKTERVLKERTKWIQGIAECVGGMIWETDENGLYRHCSPTVESLLGYSSDEIAGTMHYYDFFVPEERESLKAAAENAFASRTPFRAFRNRIVRKDGCVLELETNAVPIFTPDGTFSGYCGIDIVVSEEKRKTTLLKTNPNQGHSRKRARVKKEG
jgi:PAS domain S-box-containing protein